MIKFLGERDGRPLLGLGLSRANCKLLLKRKPIFIDLKVMMMDVNRQLPPLNECLILIFGGETEESMKADISANVDLSKTNVRVDPGDTHS